MYKKIKNIIESVDLFLFKIFGSYKSTKILQNYKEAQLIFSYLNENKNEVKFVGGCVRKSLKGEKIDDIDLATSLIPEDVKNRLIKQGVKVVDTGISHGTITAILNKKSFEITSLRKDISTDGRHASIEHTLNWKEDASRRDFTINAIYVDLEGRIFDPFNGVLDLKNGIIKFIGSPEERIQEDYLRILRYFRFFTHYSKKECDPETVNSIKRNINGLNKISNERIFSEIKKIFSLQNIYSLFLNEKLNSIFLNIFPQFKYKKRLRKISIFNKAFKYKYDSDFILGLLIIDDSNNYEYFCHKYKVSNNIKKRFANIAKNFKNFKNKNFFTEVNIKKLIYLTNKKEVEDLLLFAICENDKLNLTNIEKLVNYVNTCKVPKFPVNGDFLKEHGYQTGETLGKKLKQIEELWIQNNFILDKKILEQSLGKTQKS